MTYRIRDLLELLKPAFLQIGWGDRWMTAIGLSSDTETEHSRIASRAALLLATESPDDALPLVGSERRMPRYPAETAAGYRARLAGAWEAYLHAGSGQAISQQIEAFGIESALVYAADDVTVPDRTTWPTRAWVVVPNGAHDYTYASGPGSADVEALRGLTRKWKASQWVVETVILVGGAAAGGGIWGHSVPGGGKNAKMTWGNAKLAGITWGDSWAHYMPVLTRRQWGYPLNLTFANSESAGVTWGGRATGYYSRS